MTDLPPGTRVETSGSGLGTVVDTRAVGQEKVYAVRFDNGNIQILSKQEFVEDKRVPTAHDYRIRKTRDDRNPPT